MTEEDLTAPARCTPGEWVEIERVLLVPADRAPGLPAETATTPLRMWLKGFACADAQFGEELQIVTMTGRTEHGRLTAVRPGYTHTFGEPPPGMASIGRDLRERLAAWRSAEDPAHEPGGETPNPPGPAGGAR